MVAKDQIGKNSTTSPLVILPDLTGTFEWTSTRSGHFHLTQAPKFAASYEFKLRTGLTDLAGKRIDVILSANIFERAMGVRMGKGRGVITGSPGSVFTGALTGVTVIDSESVPLSGVPALSVATTVSISVPLKLSRPW